MTEIVHVDRAYEITARLRELSDQSRRSYVEIGALICEAEDQKLWLYVDDHDGIPFQGEDAWLEYAIPYGRSTAYEAKSVIRELRDIPLADLYEITRGNLNMLAKLPSKERQKEEWLNDAKFLPISKFTSKVIDEKPELHIEKRVRFVATMDASQLMVADKALEKAVREMKDEGMESNQTGDALEWIFARYLD